MARRILILTFFYPPDLSAGSFRAHALVRALRHHAGPNVMIDVLTTQPNRYSSYVSEADSVEELPGLYIRRISLPKKREGFVGQAVVFWRYARRVRRLSSTREYDLVLATSSRLMTAALGGWIAYRHKAHLYLDIRDIFVENLSVLFPTVLATPLEWVFGMLERWSIGRAQRVNLVSRGFLEYFTHRYPLRHFSVISNGVDEPFVTQTMGADKIYPQQHTDRPLKVLYAGNIGDGQGLHLILPELAFKLRGRAEFLIVGEGGRSKHLNEKLRSMQIDNIKLIAPLAREKLLALYLEADVLFLHLNDYPAFRRVLPSKLFEYAATGKPILAGAAGYAAEFISTNLANAAVFEPCNAEAALKNLERLELATTDRASFVNLFTRERLMDNMAQDILQLLDSPKSKTP